MGPVRINAKPHELSTAGGTGIIWASLIHATVELPSAGKVKAAGAIVYVYTHWLVSPAQSVYVHV
jgi:hypothetical protein